MTSRNFTMLACSNFFKHFIYLRMLQSSQDLYFAFIFLMATISLLGASALKTTPNEPSPMDFNILYFYILTINIIIKFHKNHI